jgi:hypothetical protein
MIGILRRSSVRGSMVGGLLIGLLAYFAISQAVDSRRLLARHWYLQLRNAPDDRVASLMAQLAELEEASFSPLVTALRSERVQIREIAGLTLHQQIDRWQLLPAEESTRRAARLAELLAQDADSLPPEALGVVKDLALRLLTWPVDSRSVPQGELVANCESVLQISSPVIELEGAIDPMLSNQASRDSWASRGTAVAGASLSDLDLPLASLPGGGLPVDAVELPPLPPSLVDLGKLRPIQSNQPDLLPARGNQLPRVIFPDDAPPALEPEAAEPATPPRPLERQPSRDAKELSPTSMTSVEPQRPTVTAEKMSELELMQQLNDSDASIVRDAEHQLGVRGFGTIELSLARRLTSPNPQTRYELAQLLSHHPDAPGRWLYWLSFDSDPMVRRLVVTLMATSRNDQLHRRLQEMLQMEQDESVRDQLVRWDASQSKRR